jgi:hypothetical protein
VRHHARQLLPYLGRDDALLQLLIRFGQRRQTLGVSL